MKPRAATVSVLCAAPIVIALLAVLARVAQLQVQTPSSLLEHVQARKSMVTKPGVRGDLYDRAGRLLATTRFAERAFVDPLRFADPPDEAIVRLSDAIGMDAHDVGARLIPKLARSRERVATGQSAIRYVSLDRILNEAQAARVRSLKLPGVHLERRDQRVYPAGVLSSAIVGKVGVEHEGRLGAELAFDADLAGTPGAVRYVRDVSGRPLWVERGDHTESERGEDISLSIDMELQRIAAEELERGILECDARGGRLVMLDPATGEVVAMIDMVREVPGLDPYPWQPNDEENPPVFEHDASKRYDTMPPDPGRQVHAALARNRCVEDVYEPGSTFKPLVWSLITGLGRAEVDEVFDTHDGRWRTSYGRRIEDVTKRPEMTWTEVLIHSSNIGMIQGAERITERQLRDGVRAFGVGSKTGIGLPGETAGLMTSEKNWSHWTQASVSFGHEIAVTPVQMVRAFSVFARDGAMAGTLPPVTLRAVDADDPSSDVVQRVIPRRTAMLVRGALEGVVDNLDDKMRRYTDEGGWKYRLFGKSGTAEIPLGAPPEGFRRPRGADGYYVDQYNSSFVGAGPIESPELVTIVVIDDPGPDRIRNRRHYGSSTAGPVVRRVMERSLTYLGVPPSSHEVPEGEIASRN